MQFFLFSKIEFEVSCPVALIECYCFQSDFYVNYNLPSMKGDREFNLVNKIGARIQKESLAKCEEVIRTTKNVRIFEYGLDEFLKLSDETIAKLVKEGLKAMIDELTDITGIGLSTATKVLHTRYPRIIPMVDSMIQEEYRREVNPRWTQDNCSQILIDYYKNLSIEPNRQNLTEVYIKVSKNLPGLTKVRVFDILWWSYLKAKRLTEENGVNWLTIK